MGTSGDDLGGGTSGGVSGAGGGYAALAQVAIGAVQAGVSASEAKKLAEDKPYRISPALSLAYNMSRRRAEEGYSAEEKAAFEQMLARQGTAAKRMFQNVGMSGAGSAAANIMGVDAMNQFAAQGANIRRQNFGQFANMAGQVQRVQNMETGRFNQQLNMERQALGQGVQSGIGNIFGGINAAQNFGLTQQAMDIYKNMGQGGGQTGLGGGGDPNAPFGGGAANPFANTASYSSGQIPPGANTDYVQFMFPGNQPAYVPPPAPFGSFGFGAAPTYGPTAY